MKIPNQSLFMVYMIFLLVSFSMMATNHASRLRLVKEGGAIRESDQLGHGRDEEKRVQPYICSMDSIQVNQGPSGTLPNGIPTYTVIIENVCSQFDSLGCSNIHLNCGWFISARLINPKIFRRLAENDCLVNDGQPLLPGSSLTFAYANTYSYPLSVSNATCS